MMSTIRFPGWNLRNQAFPRLSVPVAGVHHSCRLLHRHRRDLRLLLITMQHKAYPELQHTPALVHQLGGRRVHLLALSGLMNQCHSGRSTVAPSGSLIGLHMIGPCSQPSTGRISMHRENHSQFSYLMAAAMLSASLRCQSPCSDKTKTLRMIRPWRQELPRLRRKRCYDGTCCHKSSTSSHESSFLSSPCGPWKRPCASRMEGQAI